MTTTRIDKINIRSFGRLKDFGLDIGSHSVTVIFGENESGKTTIVDAILKALFDVKSLEANFDGLDKYVPIVGERSGRDKAAKGGTGVDDGDNAVLDGTVELKIDNRQIAFPQDEPLDRVMSIPAIYARNLFVVREGDVDFRHPANWWRCVKNILGGTKDDDDYLMISSDIRKRMGIDTDGNWINRNGRNTADCLKELRNTLETLKGARGCFRKLNRLEIDKAAIDGNLQRCVEGLDQLNAARRSFLFTEGSRLVKQYDEVQTRAIKLETYNENNLRIWRNTASEITKARQILDLSIEQQERLSRSINENSEELAEWTRGIESWEELENGVIPELEVKLAEYKQEATRLQRGSAGKSLLPVWTILCSISFIAVICISLMINPVFFPVAGILCIALGFSAKTWWTSRHIVARLQVLERGVKTLFARTKHEDMDVDDISVWLTDGRNKNQELRRNVTLMKESKLPHHENVTKELSQSITNLDSTLQKLINFTAAFETTTKCSSWEELHAKCNEKKTLQVSLSILSDQINQLLETSFEEEWREKLDALRPVAEAKTEWNEAAAGRQAELAETLRSQSKALSNSIAERKSEVERLGCKTETDVWDKEDAITDKLSRLEADREGALLASELLSVISREQNKIVNDVISGGIGSASDLFSSVTGNKHRGVMLDDDNIFVNADDKDARLPIAHLSSGARMQLYFTLRVNLAQRLLHGNPAFLLLDDPFLACDSTRTNEMVAILHEIAKRGWQLIYFTISEDMITQFKEQFNGDLHILRLPSRNYSGV